MLDGFKSSTTNAISFYFRVIILFLTILLTSLLVLFLLAWCIHFIFKIETFSTEQFGLLNLLASLIIAASTIWAVFLAAIGIRNTRETAKLQETLNFIKDAQFDREYNDAKISWSKHRGSEENDEDDEFAAVIAVSYAREIASALDSRLSAEGHLDSQRKIRRQSEITDLEKIAADWEEWHGVTQDHWYEAAQKDTQNIVLYLNHFELIALAIEKGIIDDEFYDNWHGSLVVATWNNSVSAISALRKIKRNDRLFEKWEQLAERWSLTKERRLEILKIPNYSYRRLAILASEFANEQRKYAENRKKLEVIREN